VPPPCWPAQVLSLGESLAGLDSEVDRVRVREQACGSEPMVMGVRRWIVRVSAWASRAGILIVG
jgi:hypothetical protein